MNLSRLLWWLQEGAGGRLQWGRIHSNLDLFLAIAACIALWVYVWAMYRRDARDLGRGWGWLLAGVRSLVFLGLLLFYLQPQWRRRARGGAESPRRRAGGFEPEHETGRSRRFARQPLGPGRRVAGQDRFYRAAPRSPRRGGHAF